MENGGEKRGRGRPKKDGNALKNDAHFRISYEDDERLNFIAKELKTTRSNALRILIREAKNILKN